MTTQDSEDAADCIECGDEIPSEENAMHESGSVTNDGAEKLLNDETVGASELFGFDDGPYCSLSCSLGGGQ